MPETAQNPIGRLWILLVYVNLWLTDSTQIPYHNGLQKPYMRSLAPIQQNWKFRALTRQILNLAKNKLHYRMAEQRTMAWKQSRYRFCANSYYLIFPDLERALFVQQLFLIYPLVEMASRTGVGMRITERLDGTFSVDGMPPNGAAALSGQVQVGRVWSLSQLSSTKLPFYSWPPCRYKYCLHYKTMVF